jgi:hypothetical protein
MRTQLKHTSKTDGLTSSGKTASEFIWQTTMNQTKNSGPNSVLNYVTSQKTPLALTLLITLKKLKAKHALYQEPKFNTAECDMHMLTLKLKKT